MSAALFVVLLVAADLVAGRVVLYRNKRIFDRGWATERSYRRRDSIYHHDLAPNAHVDSAMWGGIFYPLRTNSLGFKDADTGQVDLGSARPRALFLGDSFTEGVGVPFASTFAGQLSFIASRHGVDLSNAAVASYSPIIYWRKAVDIIDRRKVPVAEVVVFVDISDIQDETNYYLDPSGRMKNRYAFGFFGDSAAGAARPSILLRIKRGLSTNSLFLHRVMANALDAVRPPPQERPECPTAPDELTMGCRAGWTSSKQAMASYGAEGLRTAQTHMSLLAEFLRNRHIPLTVVVYPWPEQLRWGDRQSLQVSIWRDWAQHENVRFVELFRPYFAAADSTSVEAVVAQDFLRGDVHWNASGHRRVSRLFTEAYCAQVTVTERRPLERALCELAIVRLGPHSMP